MSRMQMRQTKRQTIALIMLLVVTYAAAGIGGWFTSLSVGQWYEQLGKPAWTPAGSTIGLVWNVLFALMAVAAWLVWRRGNVSECREVRRSVRFALLLYAVQLAFNVGWSAVFFGLRSPGGAMIELIVLWLIILATLIAFWRVEVWAGLLLLPYIAWVSFAGGLNFTIWRMN